MDEGDSILPMKLGTSKATPGLAFIALCEILWEWGCPSWIERIELEEDPALLLWHATVEVYG